jgi:hypothetical protein
MEPMVVTHNPELAAVCVPKLVAVIDYAGWLITFVIPDFSRFGKTNPRQVMRSEVL